MLIFGSQDTIRFCKETKTCPFAPGDLAQQLVIAKLQLSKQCSENPNTRIIDVGGLYGDFGLYTGSHRCKTTIYEPQPYYAHLISTSAALNPSFSTFVEVQNAGISNAKQLRIQDGGRDKHHRKKNPGLASALPFNPNGKDREEEDALNATLQDKISINRPDSKVDTIVIIPGKSLDEEHRGQDIYLLKVDVEGFEGQVLDTAKQLFQEKRIKHLIFEFTPNQFHNRGTNYKAILDDMYYRYSATQCFALHQNKKIMYKLNQTENAAFYQYMYAQRFQLDIFCSFLSAQEIALMFQDVLDWSYPKVFSKNILW